MKYDPAHYNALLRQGILQKRADPALASVPGEVCNEIGQHLKKDSLFDRTVMVTLSPGRIGYIPTDKACLLPTAMAVNNRLKPGCAASAIVDAFVDLSGRRTTNENEGTGEPSPRTLVESRFFADHVYVNLIQAGDCGDVKGLAIVAPGAVGGTLECLHNVFPGCSCHCPPISMMPSIPV